MKRYKKRYKKKYMKRLLWLSLMFIFTLTFMTNHKIEAINSGIYSYQWKDDTLLTGRGQIVKSFYVPQNLNPYNFVISLKISQSPTLVKDLSSISIIVNNNKAYSIMLDSIDDSGIVEVKLPYYYIYKGGNSIVIEGFLKSTRERCEINDDVNWVVVERASFFSFNYSRTDSTDIRGIFDNTYYSDGRKGEVFLTLPDVLIHENYSQISSLSALIGFMNKNKDAEVNISAFKYSNLDNVDKETIVGGTPEQIKAFNSDLLNDEQWKKAEENGYIAIRKIGLKNHFIVITSNDAQLETLCKALQSESLLSQIEGVDYVLDSNKIVNEKGFDLNPSLKALGYGDFSQAGIGTKEFNYYFTIPAKKALTANNKLTFVYNYSSLVDYDKAYVTAVVNGENLMSKSLPRDEVQDRLEFTIPENFFYNTGFNISLRFNLKPEFEKCSVQDYDNIWVTMDSANSNFQLELKDRTNYSLFNAHGLLQDLNGKLDGTIAVDSYKSLSPEGIFKISSYLGRVSQGINKLLITEGKENLNNSGAVFGLTDSLIMSSLKDNLRIPIGDNGEFINRDLFIQNTPSLGAIAVTLEDQKLVITATDEVQLNNTIQKYSEAISSSDMVILKDGKIIASFGKVPVPADRGLEAMERNYNVLLGLAVLFGASICILILYYKKVK